MPPSLQAKPPPPHAQPGPQQTTGLQAQQRPWVCTASRSPPPPPPLHTSGSPWHSEAKRCAHTTCHWADFTNSALVEVVDERWDGERWSLGSVGPGPLFWGLSWGFRKEATGTTIPTSPGPGPSFPTATRS